MGFISALPGSRKDQRDQLAGASACTHWSAPSLAPSANSRLRGPKGQRGAAHRAEPRFQQGSGLPPLQLRRHRGGAVEYSQSLRYGRISAGHWGSLREVRPAENLGLRRSHTASASDAGRWISVREAQRASSPLKVCITGLCGAWREEEAQSNRCDLKALRAGRGAGGAQLTRAKGFGTHHHAEGSPPAASRGGVPPAQLAGCRR